MKTKSNTWLILCCWTILGLMSCSAAAQSNLTTYGSVIPNETLYVWAKNGLFLRATPSLQGEIIGKIPFGDTVKAISTVRGEEHSVVFFPEQEVEIVDGGDRDQFSYYGTAEKKEITKGVELSGN